MTSQTPKISVVIPSYNKVEYIGKTLDSIFSQKYANLEVIIQDGTSTDGTLEIIKNFAKRLPSVIKWESEKDEGQLDAINKGLRKATGDILTYVNADDAYWGNAFALVSEAFVRSPDNFWFAGRGIVVDKEGKEIAKPVTQYKNFLLSRNLRLFLLMTNYLMQPSIFFTPSAYKKYGPFTGTRDFVMEYDFWLKLSGKRMPVVIDGVLSEFRIEPSTQTKRLFKRVLMEDEKIVGKYTQNPIILFLHRLNNLGREISEKFV